MIIHEVNDYTKILNAEHVYGMPVRESTEPLQRYILSIKFPYAMGSPSQVLTSSDGIKIMEATNDYVLFATNNLSQPDILNIISEAQSGMNTDEFRTSMIEAPATDSRITICRSLGGNCPEGTILAVDDPTRTSPAAFPTIAVNSYKYPFTQRHKELHEIWNRQMHTAFNEHRQELMDLVQESSVHDEFAILTEGFKFYLQQIFEKIPDIIRPDFTQEQEFNNFAQTFNRFTPQILSENADFIPNVMVRLLDRIMFKKNRVNQIPMREWPNHINWESFGEVFKQFSKGHNGALGGRAEHIHKESLDVTLNKTTGKWEYKMSERHHEWLQAKMRYQSLYAQNMQTFTDALSKHANVIAITNPNGGVLNGTQRGCPILPVDGIPEGGIHTFDILIEVAQVALSKFLKESNFAA